LVSVTSSVSVLPKIFTHVAATYDGSLITLYINGSQVGSANQSGNIVSNNSALFVGYGQDVINHFQGLVDEVKIWNISRTPSQIRTTFHTSLPNASSANLIAYYRFDETAGSNTVVDASNNCNALSFVGSILPVFVNSKLAFGNPVSVEQVFYTNSPASFPGLPIQLALNGFSGQDTIVIHQFSGTPKDSIPLGVTNIGKKYWIAYKYGSGTFTSVDATFSLGVGNLLSTVTNSDLSIFSRENTSLLSWSLLKNPASSTNFVTQEVAFNVTAANLFNKQWIIGANNNPLPVKLLSFFGDAKNQDANLYWSTANEVNNKGFAIERAVDGESFREIGFVKGSGNSNSVIKYTFNDLGIFASNKHAYYRLKQIDMDGKFEYSKIIIVKNNGSKTNNVSVYPNPIENNLTIELESIETGVAKLLVTDMAGKTVSEIELNIGIGYNKFDINNFAHINKGIYLINVVTNGTTIYQNKFIKN
jgi:hypothetical protein